MNHWWAKPDVWLTVFYAATVLVALLGRYSVRPLERRYGAVVALLLATVGNAILGGTSTGSISGKARTAFWAELAVMAIYCLPSFLRYLKQDPPVEAESGQLPQEPVPEMPARHLNPT